MGDFHLQIWCLPIKIEVSNGFDWVWWRAWLEWAKPQRWQRGGIWYLAISRDQGLVTGKCCAKLGSSTTLVAALPCRLDISSDNFKCLGSISFRAASTLQSAEKSDRRLLLSVPYHADWTDLMNIWRILKTLESSGVRDWSGRNHRRWHRDIKSCDSFGKSETEIAKGCSSSVRMEIQKYCTMHERISVREFILNW